MKIDLTLRDKLFITLWLSFIALLMGGIEAEAFVRINYPFYFVMYAFMIFVLLSIFPFMTEVKTDWLLVIGGSFLVQFFQDIGHWAIKAFFLRNWKFGVDPFWTPLWDMFGINCHIPLFWIIDLSIFAIFAGIWYYEEIRDEF